MCEFHLKGECFHPEKATRGLVATTCTYHDCDDCTNKNWQKNIIEENYSYYESIVKLTAASKQKINSLEKENSQTQIISTKK